MGGLPISNGFYRLRKNNEGPPTACPHWYVRTSCQNAGGRPWFEKDDDCYIFWSHYNARWLLYRGQGTQRGHTYYYADSLGALPPTEGWDYFLAFLDESV